MALEVRQRRRRPAPASEAETMRASDDYEVGYKKPPMHTRFRPGQSGNPKGRPAGSKSFKTLIDRELSTKLTVREGGRVITLPKRELLVKQLVNKAIEGDHRSQQMLLKFDQELAVSGRLANDNAPPGDAALQQDDRAIVDAFAAMLKGNAEIVTEEPNQGKRSADRKADDNGIENGS